MKLVKLSESSPAKDVSSQEASSVGTKVTVNAAFLAEVKTIHHELWDLLEETKTMCHQTYRSAKWQTRFVESMCELRDLFAMQFSLEEGLGYFDEPVYVEANVSRRASTLRDDHQSLYKEISRICEWLEDLRYSGGLSGEMSNIRVCFESFYDQIQTHEKREGELIYEAYCNDIGTGD